MALKALFLDVDGTLAETESRGHLPAYNKAFRELGLSWRWSSNLYRKLLVKSGTSGRERLRHYLTHYAPPLGRHEQEAQSDPEGWVKSVHAAKSRHFGDLLKSGDIPLRPGVARLMREAHTRGLKLALVTNASRESMQAFLAHGLGSELRQTVDLVVEGDPAVSKKPAPDLYLKALKDLSLAPHECVAIEDSEPGLQAATSAGIVTVVTVNDYTSGQQFANAALVVDSLGEPDAPFTVIQGDADDARWVTPALLSKLLDRYGSADRRTRLTR